MKHHITRGQLLAILMVASVALSTTVPVLAVETDQTAQSDSVSQEQPENEQADNSDSADGADSEEQAEEADAQDSGAQDSAQQNLSGQSQDSSEQQPQADADSASDEGDSEDDSEDIVQPQQNTDESQQSADEQQESADESQDEDALQSDESTGEYENIFTLDTEDDHVEYPLDVDFGKMASSLKKDSQGRYNVRTCGAGPSKSERTNWNVIQNCLNQARGKSGTTVVYIPSGTYTIQYSLRVYSNTRIVMDSGTVLKQGSSHSDILVNEFNTGAGGYSLASNITVSGGTLDGSNTSSSKNGTLLHFFHSRNIRLENLTVANGCVRHAVVLGGIDTINVSGCTFRNCRRASLGSNAVVSEALHIDSISPDGVSETTKPWDGTVCTNVTVQNCRFQGVYCGVGGHYSDYPQRGNGFTVKNCTFSDISYTAIDAMNYNNINISGNSSSGGRFFSEIYNCTGSVSGNSCGNTSDSMLSVWSWPGCSQDGSLTISNNTFGNNGKYALDLRTGTPNNITKNGVTLRQGVNIANVTIRDNTFGTSVQGGLFANNATNITFSGNRLGTVSSGSGITISNVKTASVTGNTIENASADGIRISGSSTGVTVNSNEIEACSGKGINALASATGSANSNTAPSASTYNNSRFTISGTMEGGRWVNVNGGRHFYKGGKDVYRNAWARIGGSWYYFGNDSVAYRNRWFWNGAQWFYFGNDCAAYANRWFWNGAQWFYFGSDAAAYANRWFWNGAQWFYFGNDCAAYANRWFWNGAQWFYFGSDAAAYANRWFWNGAQWFYFGSDAAAYANTRAKIGGHWYSFGGDAAMK